MKPLRLFLFLFFTILFSGCPARSVHPLFTDDDAVFNPALLGTWVSGDETYTFEKLKEKNYQLVIKERKENDSAVYAVWLGKLGTHWFLDSYPLVNSEEHHYLPVHVFTRMKLQGDTLRLAIFEADWLSKMIDEKKIKIDHVKRESETILTASTKELQKLFSTIGGNDEAFPDENAFGRMR